MSLQYNNQRSLMVWVDGACLDNHDTYGNRRAGYGVWFNDDHPWNSCGPVRNAEPTNQNAEIEAAIQAIDIICSNTGCRRIEIHTDSMFLVQSMTQWIPNWKTNGWKKTNGDPVRNQAKFKELDQLMTSYNVKIFLKHVPRSSEPGNVEADALARRGAKEY